MPSRPARVLFVNGGILGLISFYDFLQRWLPAQPGLDAEHVLLTQRLTHEERLFRRVLCQRFWKDGWLGLANLDAGRFRAELHAGLLARRRIAALDPRRFDVLPFHRQATAYGSLDLMREIPSIVSIDCTQSCVVEQAATALERRTYAPNIRVDGVVFRRAARIIATSRWAEQSLRSMYPDCTTPVHVLGSPVLLEWFDPRWVELRRERARRGIKPRALFVGGDFPRKGGYDLLAAWRAGALHERADLELVTNWPLETPLPPGVTQVRDVAPHTQQWVERWRGADLFVLPTRNEAFGLVFQEAAAAGLPAIGTQLNAVPEIVRGGETGLLVPPGDVDALGRAMATRVGSAELREQLGRRARQVVEAIAAPGRYLAELAAIIEAARESRRMS